MCGLRLALASCFRVGVHRKILRFHHYSTFSELQRKQKLFFPMLSRGLLIYTPDVRSIGFELRHMCALHPDPRSQVLTNVALERSCMVLCSPNG